ncbi:hypothetical protein FA13DRAFT_1169482 [Coprinellus micaceus]|uniref:Uncharacterized protein n=1 Tax=Coprinellus micaceus TaxID=71717 RepID=A0A4Y7SUA1_COPMI|nr:hypothetical protein FA13DRAFT_1169482 [Coprinellus micaceus]
MLGKWQAVLSPSANELLPNRRYCVASEFNGGTGPLTPLTATNPTKANSSATNAQTNSRFFSFSGSYALDLSDNVRLRVRIHSPINNLSVCCSPHNERFAQTI